MRPGRYVLVAWILVLLATASPAAAAPEGPLSWAVHVSIAPTWFDPSENPGIITPMMTLYAVHDALVKPMPGNAMAPSLAESWSVSGLGLIQYHPYSSPYEELRLKK